MKRLFFVFAALAVLMAWPADALAQKVNYRQSQSRMVEPQSQVFVRPLVVELQVLNSERQVDEWEVPELDITKATVEDIANEKVNALYKSAQKHDADVIVAPTFDIRTAKKGIVITVIGFPAKYVNWQVAREERDYKWIEDVYGVKIRTINSMQSLGDNQAKNSDASK